MDHPRNGADVTAIALVYYGLLLLLIAGAGAVSEWLLERRDPDIWN